MQAARELRPDVIVADISMPHLNGIDALALLKHDNPTVRVVFLTMHRDAAYARRALAAGAAGFVLSTRRRPSWCWRCARRWRAHVHHSRPGRRGLAHGRRDAEREADPVAAITRGSARSCSCRRGEAAKEIASALGLRRTVEDHKYRLMESLGLDNSAELIRSRSARPGSAVSPT